MAAKAKGKGILLMLFLLIIIVAIAFVSTEIFQIQKITVQGNNDIDRKSIISISGINKGDNIFKLNKEIVKNRIETNPCVVVLSITRKYPDEIIIHVGERRPCAAVPYLGGYIITDKKGYILSIENQIDMNRYPIIDGMYVKSFALGKKLVSGDNYQFKALIRLLEELFDQGTLDKIGRIDLNNSDDIYIVTRNGLFIRIGQAIDVGKKVLWLKSNEFAKLDNESLKGTLDITVPGKAIFTPEDKRGDSHE